VLGNKSILGDKGSESFTLEVETLQRRLSLLFEALEVVPGAPRRCVPSRRASHFSVSVAPLMSDSHGHF
jgi:hypothetical protein